jgi:hypothetical protein
MILALELDDQTQRILEALKGTTQWGETCEDVGLRLIQQRIWQLSGDALKPPQIGAHTNPRAANQITTPEA